jgi:exodeoxyribonuclease-5
MLHKLEGDQVVAYDRARSFIEQCADKTAKQILQIDGLAGTGKTEIVAHLANDYRMPVLTLTGKAADVLRREREIGANTIHSFLYGLPELERHLRCNVKTCGTNVEQRLKACPVERTVTSSNGDCSNITVGYEYQVVKGGMVCPTCASDLIQTRHDIPHFDLHRLRPGEMNGKVAIIDESSMIGPTLANELLRTGINLVVFGDPGQLPPVNEPRHFNDPVIFLTEIHRFAKDSGIYRQAHAVRRGIMYADDTAFEIRRKLTEDDVLNADARICWKNKTRYELTNKIRAWRGYDGKIPQVGEPVLCLRNKHSTKEGMQYEVWNGQVYTLAGNFDPDWSRNMDVIDETTGQRFTIPNVYFDDPTSGQIVPPDANFFYFGYVLTAHKAQGSGWDNVIVFDEMPNNRQDRSCWVYTAITRSKKSTVMAPCGGGPGY